MEEFHDFVHRVRPADQGVRLRHDDAAVLGGGEPASSGDRVLELHEFITMLVRIAFYRANPRSGMINVKQTEGHKDLGAEQMVVPLPGCLTSLLKERCCRSRARQRRRVQEHDTRRAVGRSGARAPSGTRLLDWWEIASGGKDTLELEPFLDEMEKALLFNDLSVADAKGEQHRVRFSIPQAKAAFCASCAPAHQGDDARHSSPRSSRARATKYKGAAVMTASQGIGGFVRNLLGEADEEQIVVEATGGAKVERKFRKAQASRAAAASPPPSMPAAPPPPVAASAAADRCRADRGSGSQNPAKGLVRHRMP